MSVKAMSLVWDLECPAKINGLDFKPNHKYVLIAYADHADHNGKSIWPAMETISKKTGMDYRTVQRATKHLHEIGLLVDDGTGPRGTNRWCLPFSEKGDKLTPVKLTYDKLTGVKEEDSLLDNSSLDIPLSDKLPEELKEPEQEIIKYIYNNISGSWDDTKEKLRSDFKQAQFLTWIVPTEVVSFENSTLTVMALNDYARNWLDEHVKLLAQTHLGVYVKFVVPEPEEA